jgi:hypothetical protein
MEAIIKKLSKLLNNNRNISNYVIRNIYNLKYRNNSIIVKVNHLKNFDSHIIEEYEPKHIFNSYLPKFEIGEEKVVKVEVPKICLYKFNQATVNINSSSILYNNSLIVNKGENEKINEGFVQYHDNNYAKISLNNIEEIQDGLFLGGNGSWNWYHFIIEILPKLAIYDNSVSRTLLVNDVVLSIPNMDIILKSLIKDIKYDIKYLNGNKNYFIKKLYYINNFNNVQFNNYQGTITFEDTYFNSEYLKKFSNLVSNKLNIKCDGKYDKIFLYRKDTHRIANNQDEILNYLSKDGFMAISMEELTIMEQIEIFCNVKFIVGISGAAWANIIFCKNNPKAICFLDNTAKEFCAFSNISKIFGVDYYAFGYENDTHLDSNDFNIDFLRFKKNYELIRGK